MSHTVQKRDTVVTESNTLCSNKNADRLSSAHICPPLKPNIYIYDCIVANNIARYFSVRTRPRRILGQFICDFVFQFIRTLFIYLFIYLLHTNIFSTTLLSNKYDHRVLDCIVEERISPGGMCLTGGNIRLLYVVFCFSFQQVFQYKNDKKFRCVHFALQCHIYTFCDPLNSLQFDINFTDSLCCTGNKSLANEFRTLT